MSASTFVKQHPVATFLGATVAIGWLVTGITASLPSSAALLQLVAIPVSYVPAILAVVVLSFAGSPEDRREFRRSLTTVRVGWRWLAFALVLPLIHLAGVGLATLAGGRVVLHPELLAILPLFLITNLGEEIGWRGYALPRLQGRLSALSAALLIGGVWAAFHWVALLGNGASAPGYIAVSTVQLIAMSVIMGVAFNSARRAVPLVVLIHAAYDTVSIGVVPLIDTGVPLLAFAITAGLTCLVAIGLVRWTGSSLVIADGTRAGVGAVAAPAHG